MATFKSKYTGIKVEELLDKMADITKFDVKDIYPTLADLQAAFPTGNEYAYQVTADQNVYIWSAINEAWESLGQLQGEKGADGAPGADGKTAYQSAVDGGYAGTEEEFEIILATAQSQLSEVNLSLTTQNRGVNLLHNWDFRNPVNQRLANSYAGSGYTIDRWSFITDGSTLTLTNGIVSSILLAANYRGFMQRVENYAKFAGKTVTISVDIESLTGSGALFLRASDGVGEYGYTSPYQITSTGIHSVTFTVSESCTLLNVFLENRSATASITFTPLSIKLELGTKSTLANDPPMDYGKELAVCQRYQRIPDTSTICEIGTGIAISATDIRIPIKFPIRMRDLPVLSVTPSEFQVSDFSGAPIVLTGLSINSAQNGIDSTVLIATVASGLTQFRTYQLTPVMAGNKMIFSTNL